MSKTTRSYYIRGGYLLYFITVFLFIIPQTASVQAGIESCSASVSPTAVNVSTRASLTFRVTNNDQTEAYWIKISVPNSNFTIVGYSISNWSASRTDTEIIFNGGTLNGTESVNAVVETQSGSSEASSADWNVQVSDDPAGADPTTCGGSTGVAISGSAPDTTGPAISDIVVSDVTDSSVKISWSTDESANSAVDYGATDEYGSTASDGTMTTSHSLTISSLSANTTYHYNVKSTDSSNNTGESGDNTFVTARTGSTGVTQTGTTTTVTVTRTVTPTPSPTPTPDLTPPKVSVKTRLEKSYQKTSAIEGAASDVSNVDSIEYSLDNGRNWQRVDEPVIFGKPGISFSFTPEYLMDDSYAVKIRATDGKGNSGITKVGTLVIDRLPPQVGASVFSLGPQEISAGSDGAPVISVGLTHKLTVSAVGGPTEIIVRCEPVANQTEIKSVSGCEKITLTKNPETGLWSGEFNIQNTGDYTLTANAVDGADNKTTRYLGTIRAVSGVWVIDSERKPIPGAEVKVLVKEPVTNGFVFWDGPAFGQTNPVKPGVDNRLYMYLPSGEYVFEISAPGYTVRTTQIVKITHPMPVSAAVELVKSRVISIGPFEIPVPEFGQTELPFAVSDPYGTAKNKLTGSTVPEFSIPLADREFTDLDLRGKRTILAVIPMFIPQAGMEISALDKLAIIRKLNAVVIAPHQSYSSVLIAKNLGKYNLNIVADPDGILVEKFGIFTAPLYMVVNGNGVIETGAVGFLSDNEIIDILK